MGTINGEPNACSDVDKVKRVVAEMKVTKMTDNKVKEMIAMIQEAGAAMTSNMLRTVIRTSQEEGGDRKGESYKDEGRGR